ncbi:hypothetical protein FACS1894218_1360 [Bacilli bacterium]|nr:hypothetical protein FACS1894218_1360 [Bacilli bacterium]
MKDKKHTITRFNKLFIIDINPSNDDITNELVVGKLSRVIKNAALYQNVVIVGHANLTILKQMTKDTNIKSAYIISDNGARIYNIKDNAVV